MLVWTRLQAGVGGFISTCVTGSGRPDPVPQDNSHDRMTHLNSQYN